MTPQEYQRVAELFDRLATLESNQRDPQAGQAIDEGLRKAPNAIYALVQTVLIQDEALRNADARIRELEGGGEPNGRGSFLDSMRGALFGGRDEARGSVPSVRTGGASPSWQERMQAGAPQPQSGGGSFLGTAAAAAAGVIGGTLLMNSMRSMFGGNQHGVMDQSAGGGQTPWGGNSANSDLARDVGVNDIGRSAQGERAGLFDTAQNDADSDNDDGDFGDDFDLGGDSDFA